VFCQVAQAYDDKVPVHGSRHVLLPVFRRYSLLPIDFSTIHDSSGFGSLIRRGAEASTGAPARWDEPIDEMDRMVDGRIEDLRYRQSDLGATPARATILIPSDSD
jgi:hypothetical protein